MNLTSDWVFILECKIALDIWIAVHGLSLLSQLGFKR